MLQHGSNTFVLVGNRASDYLGTTMLRIRLKALRQHADERGYQYIDLHSVFVDAKGALKSDLSNDGIHLLAPGYRLWRSEIIGLL